MTILDKIRLLRAAQKLGKLMTLKLTTSTVMQMLLTAAHILNLMAPSVPDKWKPYVALGLGLCNLGVNFVSHMSNPDGTSVTEAYHPPQ